MDKAMVDRRDAVVTLDSKEHVQRIVTASQSESIVDMLSGQVDCTMSSETRVHVNDTLHTMWVRNVINSLGVINLVILATAQGEFVKAVVIDIEHDEWKPRQMIYLYSLDGGDDTPDIMSFL